MKEKKPNDFAHTCYCAAREPKKDRLFCLLEMKMFTDHMAVVATAPLKVKLSENVWLGVVVRKYISNTVKLSECWLLVSCVLRTTIPNLISLFIIFFHFFCVWFD